MSVVGSQLSTKKYGMRGDEIFAAATNVNQIFAMCAWKLGNVIQSITEIVL